LAVYTHISDAELEEYLRLYEIGEMHSLKGIAEGVENSNYLLSTDAGLHILTLYEKRVDPADLPFFLGLKSHLASRQINCPEPIPMRSGEVLGKLSGKPCAIISYLDGNSVRRPKAYHCEQVGKALAHMHLAGQDFPLSRANALTISDWPTLFEMSEDRANEVQPELHETVRQELGFLLSNWPPELPMGVIHADLFPDNVFFLKGELSGIIDFYFACNDYLAYDLAVCLNAWCFEPDHSFNMTKGMALIRGYESVRALTGQEREALPVLCRGSALRFLLTRLYDWLNVPDGALVKPHSPMEYISKLKFHQNVCNASDYGVAT